MECARDGVEGGEVPKSKITPKEYVELARISQGSFEERRKIEWRVNFSLWPALGLLTYWAKKEKIYLFNDLCSGLLCALLVLFVYFALLVLISSCHRKDKDFKHYYMKMAEGIKDKRPPPKREWPERLQWIWIAPYIIFTAGLLYFAQDSLTGKVETGPGARNKIINELQMKGSIQIDGKKYEIQIEEKKNGQGE